MREVEVVLSKSTLEFPIFSWIIQAVLRKPYSHSSTRHVDEITNQVIVHESSHGEAHEITLENWIKSNKALKKYSITVTDEQFVEYRKICNSTKQIPYSRFFGMLGVLVHILSFGKLAWFEDGLRTVFCSEVDVFKLSAIGIIFIKDHNFVTPRDIEERLDSLAETDPGRVCICFINI